MNRFKNRLVSAGLILATLTLPLTADEKPIPRCGTQFPLAERPTIEVAFVLDTTGSMGGLLDGAKKKIWSIVNRIASAKPSPRVKLALVAYRDKGDAYVTKRTDLTEDIDAVFADLMALTAGGGGDHPEHVNQALHEAVSRLSWSQAKRTYRVLFLVGDAPPHEYKDDVDYGVTCEKAVRAGIVINAIRCGGDPLTAKAWKSIADLSEGKFVSIDQTGGVQTVSTPYDKKLAKLGRRLDGTRLYYGRSELRKNAKLKGGRHRAVADAAAPEAAADRAGFMASKAPTSGGRMSGDPGVVDLVAKIENNSELAEELDTEKLPENLKKMDSEKRKAYLEKRVSERKALRKEIQELSKKRSKHIREAMKKSSSAGDSFDEKVFGMIREQAAKKGLSYEK